MAITDFTDECGSQGSLSAFDRALMQTLNNSKGSLHDVDDDDESSYCDDETATSVSIDTVATNLDASNHSEAQTEERSERRVQFSERCKVRRIPHHSSLTDQQIADMWISKLEYKQLRKDCAKRVQFLEKMKLKDPRREAPFCTRGLLHHTAAARAKKSAYRDVMYDALAQALDNELGERMDKALSEICRICSAPSVKTAHLQGLEDERDAKKIHSMK